MLTTHENLTNILVNGLFAISRGWHILDNDSMVGMLGENFPFWFEKFRIGQDIRNTFWFWRLFGLKLLFWRKVLSVIITQMIVGNNGFRFDSCSCQEIHKSSFEFCLTSFEIVSNVNSSFYFMHTWQKCILWWTVDKSTALLHGSNGK